MNMRSKQAPSKISCEAVASMPDSGSSELSESSESKKANTSTSVPTKQKVNLEAIDQGFCLITREKDPAIAIQAYHILRRRTAEAKMNEYKLMWDLPQFDVDSTANLVHLRADWYAAYDDNCWAFVPSIDILREMEKIGCDASFTKPYRNYKCEEGTDYVFVAFPTLERKCILRATNDDDLEDFEMYTPDDGFADFPTIRHHSHPYFVIANALPKFEAHRDDLTANQEILYGKLVTIQGFWRVRLGSATSLPRSNHKRPRDDEDEGSEDGQDRRDFSGGKGGSKRKASGDRDRETTQAKTGVEAMEKGRYRKRKATKGEGGQPKETAVTKISHIPRQSPYPSPPRTTRLQLPNDGDSKASYYDADANVLLWVNKTFTDRPAEAVGTDVITLDNEAVRSPYMGDWHEWCFPWIPPPDTSKYSSIDWAMKRYLFNLTAAPRVWESSDEEDTAFSDHDSALSSS